MPNPRVLSQIDLGEDAGVYLLAKNLAIVQTLDFFPPMVDDPYTFGQIAAANALSDLYAMGATPVTAMNIVAFPCSLDMSILEEILQGGCSKVQEAGASMLGGHTIDDKEPKYGLSVTGTINPEKIMSVEGARPGDAIILTKPIGTGILTTAIKAEFVTENEIRDAVDSMLTLNREASRILFKYSAHACTDVTGFGLIGHLYDILKAGGVSCEIWTAYIPVFERTIEMAGKGMMPGGLYRNKKHTESRERCEEAVEPLTLDCLHDPQTSGGLLAAVAAEESGAILGDLRNGPCPLAAVIGVINPGPEPLINIKKEGVLS